MKKQLFGLDILSDQRSAQRTLALCKYMKSIIDLGVKGYFPLFYQKWIDRYQGIHRYIKSDPATRRLTKKIILRINKHTSFERKRTILASLDENELMIFIHEFMNMVEVKVLDNKPEIH